MSCTREGKELPAIITDKRVAALVAGILRQEYPKSDAPIKRIALTSELNRNTIAKLYNGRNAPNTANFLMLVRGNPSMLRMMLELIDRSDVWELCVQNGIPQKMRLSHPGTHPRQGIYSDRFVSINVVVDLQAGGQLNRRQLWFLGKLQQGKRVKAESIVSKWRSTPRTARRDIAGLMAARLICFIGARRNGHYEIMRYRKARP